MHRIKDLPILKGEALYIPFIGAIIERTHEGQRQVLIQIRQKPQDDYHDSIEIPGGKMKAFEDIYETVRREVKEETGLNITFIQGEDKRSDFQNREDTSSEIVPFCVTQMKKGPYIGIIFLCQATGEPLLKTAETKEARWISCTELLHIVTSTPEKVYTAILTPLKKYLTLCKKQKLL